MLQARRDGNFPEEPLRPERARQLVMEHLEGDRPVMPKVLRQVDRGHAPAPEFALERVAVGQCRLQSFYGLGQRDLSSWGVSRLSLRPGFSQSYSPTTTLLRDKGSAIQFLCVSWYDKL